MTDATSPTLDLSRLPAGTMVTIDYEAGMAARRAALVTSYAAIGRSFAVDATELDPAVKLQEVDQSRMDIALQAINDAGKANQLANAAGPDLDQLGANVGCLRLQQVDPTTQAPLFDPSTGAAIMELDDRYRLRIQEWNERLSTGCRGYYRVVAMTAVPSLGDVSVVNPAPGQIVVTLMGSGIDPTPTPAEVAAAQAFLFREDVKGATHELTVQPCDVILAPLAAQLLIYPGPDPDTAVNAAMAALTAFLALNKRLGRSLLERAWIGRLQTDAVYAANALTPGDRPATPSQVVYVPTLSVTYQGIGR